MLQPPTLLQARTQATRFFGEASPGAESLAEALIGNTHRLFHGGDAGIQPCDMAFHDFAHTMQATVAALDLFEAHRRTPAIAPLSERDYLLAFAAVLFHDAGYLKKVGDNAGTGAKYTAIHVGRGCFRAWDFLPPFGFTADELRQIQNAICATAVGARMASLPFRTDREWVVAGLVATGDMMGQVAAEDYPERLAGLYLEFREASAYSRYQDSGFAVYRNLLDLLAGTEIFFGRHVLARLDIEWRGLHRLLGSGREDNPYLDRMWRNVARVKSMSTLLAQDRGTPIGGFGAQD